MQSLGRGSRHIIAEGSPSRVGTASQWWSNERMIVYIKLRMVKMLVNDGEMLINDGEMSIYFIHSFHHHWLAFHYHWEAAPTALAPRIITTILWTPPLPLDKESSILSLNTKYIFRMFLHISFYNRHSIEYILGFWLDETGYHISHYIYTIQ